MSLVQHVAVNIVLPEAVVRLHERFSDASLPAAEWNHRAHLQVAIVHLMLEPIEVAINTFRRGILELNERHGVPQTETGGYHETLTQAYMRLIHLHLQKLPRELHFKEIEESTFSKFGDKRTISRYYSRELIMSREARYGFVDPDLSPLSEPE